MKVDPSVQKYKGTLLHSHPFYVQRLLYIFINNIITKCLLKLLTLCLLFIKQCSEIEADRNHQKRFEGIL
jgi:hypothetical protein